MAVLVFVAGVRMVVVVDGSIRVRMFVRVLVVVVIVIVIGMVVAVLVLRPVRMLVTVGVFVGTHGTDVHALAAPLPLAPDARMLSAGEFRLASRGGKPCRDSLAVVAL
jgi:hypothetical protein